MRNQQRSFALLLSSASAGKTVGQAGGAEEVEPTTYETGGMAKSIAEGDGAKGGSITSRSGYAVSFIYQ